MSMTKVNIVEANSHLRELHKKVFELENKVHMQSMYVEELETVNQQLQQKVKKITDDNKDTLKEKEEEILEMGQRLDESEKQVQLLLAAAQERDLVVDKMENKARLFYEVVEHRSALARMVEVLDELSEQEDADKDGVSGGDGGGFGKHEDSGERNESGDKGGGGVGDGGGSDVEGGSSDGVQ